jgi:hypothetical protein
MNIGWSVPGFRTCCDRGRWHDLDLWKVQMNQMGVMLLPQHEQMIPCVRIQVHEFTISIVVGSNREVDEKPRDHDSMNVH